ncbi:hypothetical protein PV11_04765 [Exophiala sideris]|uniref:Zn(2)-C6 fungal-type domain-containing protein n=1 Tax=Exophiala sideris TaxID=1016849 RepID=A0A0D1X4V1_9EURO|nr:hypothetical protein PV11_04765 [Exophiala sideris]
MSELRSSIDASPRQRVINACRRCRQRKVKCSGEQPCINCERRKQSCVFDEASRRVVISERHLHELQSRASGPYDRHQLTITRESSQHAPHAHAAQSRDPSQGTASLRQDIWSHATSHVDLSQTNFNTTSHAAVEAPELDRSQEEVFHPNVSTWAFCRDARRALLNEATDEVQHIGESQRSTYEFSRHTERGNGVIVTSLPPKSYISHLAQVCDFRLNPSQYCFDLLKFQKRLDKSDLSSLETTSSVWHANILAILALGKLFLEKGASVIGPPGVREFQRAISVLPTTIILSQDPLTTIQTLLLLSMYSQAADMHSVAYLYTGQAAGLMRSSGLMKRPWPMVGSDTVDADQRHTLECVQKLWWTVCLIDQKQAFTIDAEANCPIVEVDDNALSLGLVYEHADRSLLRTHLSVAEFVTRVKGVLNAYSNGQTTSESFSTRISTQLVAARKLAERLRNSHQLCQGKDFTSISRPVATLYLSYYQAVLHATKPFLIDYISTCITPVFVHSTTTIDSQGSLKLLKTCVKAAAYSLNVIHALHEQGVLETFNFWDLEATFTSALGLTLAHGIFTASIDGPLLAVGKDVLRDMSNRGNIPAKALLQELDNIHDMLDSTAPTQLTRLGLSLQLSLHLTHDGTAVNDAIVNVLEVEEPLTGSLAINELQAQHFMPSVIETFQQSSAEQLQELTLMPDLASTDQALGENVSMPQDPAFYLDNFVDFTIPDDLDMTGPGSDGWLDFV